MKRIARPSPSAAWVSYMRACQAAWATYTEACDAAWKKYMERRHG